MNRRLHFTILLLCLFPLLLGMGWTEKLDTDYGIRWSKTVNGTAAIQEMMRKAGFHVTTRRNLSPQLQERADCLIWMDGDYGIPTKENLQWLNEWLRAKQNRVLVYIPRDYEASTFYWKQIQSKPNLSKAELKEYRTKQTAANQDFDNALLGQADEEACDWLVRRKRKRPARTLLPGKKLQGETRWTTSIDPKKVQIAVNMGIEPAFSADVLLALDDEIIVSRLPIETVSGEDSYLVTVTNASFVANYGLVNHEHRKLAGRLIEEIEALNGEPSQAVFLENPYEGALPMSDSDTPESSQMSWSFFSVPPLSYIFMHLALIAVIFAFSRWPIFGTPKVELSTGTQDFGKHVEALGELLEQSGDRTFAKQRLDHYQNTVQHSNPFHRSDHPKPKTTKQEGVKSNEVSSGNVTNNDVSNKDISSENVPSEDVSVEPSTPNPASDQPQHDPLNTFNKPS